MSDYRETAVSSPLSSASGVETSTKQVWSMRSSVQSIGDVRESELSAHQFLGKLSSSTAGMLEGLDIQRLVSSGSDVPHSRFQNARVVDIKTGSETGSPTHSIDTVSTSASPSEESRPLFVPAVSGATDAIFSPSTSIVTAQEHRALAPGTSASIAAFSSMHNAMSSASRFDTHGGFPATSMSLPSHSYGYSQQLSSFLGTLPGASSPSVSAIESSAPSVLTMISAKQDEGQTITSSDLGAILPALRVTDTSRTIALARAHAQASILPEGAPKSKLLIEAEARGALGEHSICVFLVRHC